MEDNQNTIAFIQWLAKSLDQDPETIMQSVEEAMKTEEGQQQIMQLYQKFEQQEQQNQMFKKGGKIDAFARKYAGGGNFYKRWTADDIRKLQTFLAGHGYNPGDLDGIMGAKTIAAIKAYQKDHNLTQDSLWGTNTNKEQKVLSSDIINKGVYRPTHSYERGTMQAYDNTAITNIRQMDPKTFQELYMYYLNHPEEFFDETNANASKFRQILHNSGKTGADIINQIYAGTNPDERRAIAGKIKTGQINSDETKSAIYRAQEQVAPVVGGLLAAPMAIGTALAAPVATVGGLVGAKFGADVGRGIGEDIAMSSKDKAIYHDATATNYGVGNITYDPERRIQESGDLGAAYGGIAGAALGALGAQNVGKIQQAWNTALENERAAIGASSGKDASIELNSRYADKYHPSANNYRRLRPYSNPEIGNNRLVDDGIAHWVYPGVSGYKHGGELPLIKKAQSGIKVPIRSNPTFARWSAEWNAKKDPAEGIEDRRTGYAMDSKGGQYYFEDGVKDGYSFKTYMTVPQPGDTIVTQKVASDKGWLDNDYPMGSYEYKSVMSRNRGNKGWTIMDAIRKVMDKK